MTSTIEREIKLDPDDFSKNEIDWKALTKKATEAEKPSEATSPADSSESDSEEEQQQQPADPQQPAGEKKKRVSNRISLFNQF